jgi:glycosyltransferase involved in cell wall biosynthesis
MGAFITFVTTCRGRLPHLRETLPTLVGQPDSAVVVVDYSCPDGSGDWVEASFPQVEVVRSASNPLFELTRARNLGAASVRSPWICFIDADTRVDASFGERLRPLLAPGYFYRAEPRTPDIWGTTVCATEDFLDIGGYDEVIQGWGRDDEDFYARLIMAGVRSAGFPGELIEALEHSDTERVEHYDIKDRWLNSSINHVYCRVKIELMLIHQSPLNLDVRKRLYDLVRSSVTAAREKGEAVTMSFPLPSQLTRACGPLNAKLVYTLPRPGSVGGKPIITTGSFIPNPARFRQRQP